MFCPQCGSKLPDGAAFCGECGASVKARVDAAAGSAAAAAQAGAPAPVEGQTPAQSGAASTAAAGAPVTAQTPAQPGAGPAASAAAPVASGDGSAVDAAALLTKHKKQLTIGGGALVVLIAVALFLSPSGNTTSLTDTTSATSATTSDDSSENETETVTVTKATKVPLSKALSKKGVWFWTSNSINSSTSELGSALVFDGKGNVTDYETTGLTAASLEGKSTDEIIKLVKKADKAWFKKEKQEDIDRYTENITSAKKEIAAIRNGTSSNSESSYTDALSRYQEAIKQIKALKYEAPSAHPFSLHIVTGTDGKSTETETIQLTGYKERRVYASASEGYDENEVVVKYVCSEEAKQIELEESSSSGLSSFSGMSFRQFGRLTKLLDEGTNEQYVVDKPTAKGVIVDI